MNELFHIFEFICVYIDDLLIFKKGYWKDYAKILELMLNQMKEKGLKYSIKNSFFQHKEMEYLGFWVTCNGVKPTNRKMQYTTNIKPPTYRKKLQKFICVINYYPNMWPGRSHKLAPLTRLTYIKRKFKWTQVKREAYEKIIILWPAIFY